MGIQIHICYNLHKHLENNKIKPSTPLQCWLELRILVKCPQNNNNYRYQYKVEKLVIIT